MPQQKPFKFPDSNPPCSNHTYISLYLANIALATTLVPLVSISLLHTSSQLLVGLIDCVLCCLHVPHPTKAGIIMSMHHQKYGVPFRAYA
jgi:hypothetical protein